MPLKHHSNKEYHSPHQADWENFLKLCMKLKTSSQLGALLELLLTKAEQEDIAVRYRIVQDLLTGKKTQRQIAQDLSTSIAKITRGSNALKIATRKIKNLFC